MTPRRAIGRRIAVAWVTGLLCALPAAWAHPDEPVVDATLRLAPGEEVAFPMVVHFHRLVATYRVHDPGAPGLTLIVGDPGATAPGAAPAFVAPLVGAGGLHHLIPCCLGVGYSDAELRVRNDGAVPVALDLRAWAVHDEFAVMAHRAESGALEVPLAAFLVLGVAAVRVSARARRRDPAIPRGAGEATRATLAFGWSLGLFAWAGAAALALGAVGAGRYGTGLVDGMMAVMADVPLPGGPFGSRAALVLGVLLLAWLASIVLWIRAVHGGAHDRSPWPVRLGVALAVVSLVAGVAMGGTYGQWPVPIGLGLVLAVPLGASALSLARARSRQGFGAGT